MNWGSVDNLRHGGKELEQVLVRGDEMLGYRWNINVISIMNEPGFSFFKRCFVCFLVLSRLSEYLSSLMPGDKEGLFLLICLCALYSCFQICYSCWGIFTYCLQYLENIFLVSSSDWEL